VIGLALLAVVAFIFVLGVFGEDNPAGDRAATDNAEPQTETEAAERPRKRPRPARPAGVTMRIAPTIPTYACVDTGDGTEVVFEGTLEEARTFRNRQTLRVNLGKRSVELRANGKQVEIVDSPDPIGFEVNRAGAEEIVEESRPCA